MSEAPLERSVAARAARWYLLLASGEASARELRDLAAWRQADPQHERAWQRAEQVSRTAGLVPAGIGRALLRQPTAEANARRKTLNTMVWLMTAAPAGWLAVKTAPWQRWNADHATATGEQKTVLLPDGTEVVLNTASAIDVGFDQHERRLLLREGEIMVATAPDPQRRPFAVRTAEGRLVPVGTRFTVRQQAGRTAIAVLEGAVDLRPLHGAQTQRLRAGRATSFSADAIAPEQPAPASASLWTRGIVAADNLRLDQLLAELARYRHGRLDCDPAVGGLRVTGGFHTRDIDGALSNIANMLALDMRYRTRFWVTLLPPAQP